MKNKFHLPLQIAVGLLAILVIGASVSAATLTQSFSSTQDLAQGTIVSLGSAGNTVESADRNNLSNLFGVVVSRGDITFSQNGQASPVNVASSGIAQTLVSNTNGSIKTGDAITVDTIAGVGEKATKSTKIIGIAQDSFTGNESSAKIFSVGQNSSKKNIKVILLPLKISVSQYVVSVTSNNSLNRSKIEQIADNLTGKTVKPFALATAGLVLIVGVFIATFLISSSGYATTISLGRNPLSARALTRNLAKLITVAVVIFAGSVLLAYLVLKFLG